MLYLAAFHLTQNEEHYEAFYTAFDQFEEILELFEGCILIDTVFTAAAIRLRLGPYLHKADRLIITRLHPASTSGILPARHTDWLIQKYHTR